MELGVDHLLHIQGGDSGEGQRVLAAVVLFLDGGTQLGVAHLGRPLGWGAQRRSAP